MPSRKSSVVLSIASVFVASAAQGAGGFSWQILPNAPVTTRHDDLHFLDQSRGWICSQDGKIWHTIDGGQSWVQQLQVLSSLRSIYFVDDQLGFCGSLDDQGDGLLYRTTNGGDSWTLIDDQIPDPEPQGLCGLTGVGDFILGCGRYFGGSPRIIRSTDRGATWTTMEMSAHVRNLIDCHFVTPDTGFVVGGSPSPGFPRILSTFDGGQTWQMRYTGSGNLQDDYCWKIFFVTRLIGYVSIQGPPFSPQVLKTLDGGITWSEIVIPGVDVRNLQGIGFANPLLGWVSGFGDNSNMETTDGGVTWTPVIIGQVGPEVNRFQMFGETFGYAAGRTVYKYLPDVMAIAAGGSPPPRSSIRLATRPNPFQSSTTVSFQVLAAGEVRVRIYDALGRQIRTLVKEQRDVGRQEVRWDGCDDTGAAVASGNYIVRVDAGGEADSRFVSVLH